ncbi:hypothetical protein LP421_25080 [Rhizobium sp. RCAM05350]|nr:hypothetical protein LP421_25080 [Rhizobium sp. RCAM05350]
MRLFSPDFLFPVGDHPDIAAFVASFDYLTSPFNTGALFFPKTPTSRLLDIQNLIAHHRKTAEWTQLVEAGVQIAKWSADDPLADVFLLQFGGFPDPTETGIDYEQLLAQATNATVITIAPDSAVPADILNHPCLALLCSYDLKPHYSSAAGWIYPGVYAGHSDEIEDLINFWNLRACGIRLLFLDLAVLDRTVELRTAYIERLRQDLSGHEGLRKLPVIWSRNDLEPNARKAIGDEFAVCQIGSGSWNGHNIRPHLMHLGGESSLGVVGGDNASAHQFCT